MADIRAILDMAREIESLKVKLEQAMSQNIDTTNGTASVYVDGCRIDFFEEDRMKILDLLEQLKTRQIDIQNAVTQLGHGQADLLNQLGVVAENVAGAGGSGPVEYAAYFSRSDDYRVYRKQHSTSNYTVDEDALNTAAVYDEERWRGFFQHRTVCENVGSSTYSQTALYRDLYFRVTPDYFRYWAGAESITLYLQACVWGTPTSPTVYVMAPNSTTPGAYTSYPSATKSSDSSINTKASAPWQQPTLGQFLVDGDSAASWKRGAIALTVPKDTFGTPAENSEVHVRVGCSLTMECNYIQNGVDSSTASNYYRLDYQPSGTNPGLGILPRAEAAHPAYGADPHFDARIVLNMPI